MNIRRKKGEANAGNVGNKEKDKQTTRKKKTETKTKMNTEIENQSRGYDSDRHKQ